MKELDAFESDALDTSDRLKELAVHLDVRGLHGGARLCERAARLIREGVVSEPPYEQEPGPEDAYGPA